MAMFNSYVKLPEGILGYDIACVNPRNGIIRGHHAPQVQRISKVWRIVVTNSFMCHWPCETSKQKHMHKFPKSIPFPYQLKNQQRINHQPSFTNCQRHRFEGITSGMHKNHDLMSCHIVPVIKVGPVAWEKYGKDVGHILYLTSKSWISGGLWYHQRTQRGI